jgi:hypothetical protein
MGIESSGSGVWDEGVGVRDLWFSGVVVEGEGLWVYTGGSSNSKPCVSSTERTMGIENSCCANASNKESLFYGLGDKGLELGVTG